MHRAEDTGWGILANAQLDVTLLCLIVITHAELTPDSIDEWFDLQF